MNRDADPEGLAFRTAQLEAGTALADVVKIAEGCMYTDGCEGVFSLKRKRAPQHPAFFIIQVESGPMNLLIGPPTYQACIIPASPS